MDEVEEKRIKMNRNHNKRLTQYSQKLRKEMTEEERKLWYTFLKTLPITIQRQKTIGNYIVDFYCGKEKVAIEIDGWQHYEEDGEKKDVERDSFLKEQGIEVLRYSNQDIRQRYKSVCEEIYRRLIKE